MRTKSEVRRDAIMTVAQEVFREVGFEAASMSQIAARVGGSKATLYNYFSSKEELLLQAMLHSADSHLNDMLQGLQTSGDLPAQLHRFVASLVKIMNDEITIKNIRVAISVGGTSDIGRQFFDLGPHKVWDEISSLLRKEIERGGLRNEDPDAMTTLLNALCEADTIRNLMGAGTPMSEKEMEQRAEYIVDIFLRAYGCKQQ